MSTVKTLVILMIFFNIATYAQNAAINFRTFKSHENVKDAAKKENKNIFLTLHYVGCPQCVKMEKNVFTDPEVGEFYNENFINLSLDINKDSLGAYYKSRFAPGGYPANIYLDQDGNLMHMALGYKPVDLFIKVGKSSRDQDRNLAFYKNKIEGGDLSAETLKKYFKIAHTFDRDSLINVYMANCNENEKFSLESWQLLSENTTNFSSPFFKFIVENEGNFRQTAGDKAVDDFLIDKWTFMVNPWSPWWANNIQRNKMKKKLRATNHPLCDRIRDRVDYMVWIERASWRKNSKRKWRKMIYSSKEYLKQGYDDWYNYHMASWLIATSYKKRGKAEDLELGLNLAEKSISSQKKFMNLLIYAFLLNESGNQPKAIETMKEALEHTEDYTEKNYIDLAHETLRTWIEDKEL
jgi:thioredoxin-related protein